MTFAAVALMPTEAQPSKFDFYYEKKETRILGFLNRFFLFFLLKCQLRFIFQLFIFFRFSFSNN